MMASFPTKTFCPSEQRSPMWAPPHTWEKCQMRVLSPIVAPWSTIALGSITDAMSIFQRQGDAAAIPGGQVGCDQDFKGFEPFPSICVWLGVALQYPDHVVVILCM